MNKQIIKLNKKIGIVIVFLFFVLYCSAQKYKTTRSYIYSHLVVQYPNGEKDYDGIATGAIIFGMKDGKECIGISLDKEIIYQGFIVKKEWEVENGLPLVSYKFTSYYNGITSSIVLSEIYETATSKVPFMFFLTILNKYSNKPARYNIFTNIQ